MLSEPDFQLRVDETLQSLYRQLNRAADAYGFDIDFNAGKLTVEFDDPPTKFVVSPNSPVRQIWVSALVKSFKLDWSDSQATFVLADTGQTLAALMASAIGQQLGEPVELT